jgi:hypothetical protein
MPRHPNRDFALRLAEVGLKIFPCNQSKKPLVGWREESTDNADLIAEWWDQYPGALPAIDLAKVNLLVLDGDRHGGPDGRAALRDLCGSISGVDWAAAPAAFTPRDGVHVYLHQNGHALGNRRGNLPPASMFAALADM